MAREIFVGSVSVGVVPDARGWNRTLERELVPSSSRIGDEMGQNMSRKITDQMGKAGGDSAGAFSKTFRKRLEEAIKTLPKIKIDAESTDAERKVADLRRRMEELSGKKIGLDISSDAAMLELGKIEAELKVVQHSAENIDVRFNTTAALAQLALLKHEADRAGNESGSGLERGILGGINAAIGSAGSVGGGGSGIGGLVTSSPAAMAIAAAVGIVGLPVIATAVSGAVVTIFGGMIAGMAIMGAAKAPEVQKAFKDLKDRAVENLQIIGQSWVPVLESILNNARQTFDKLTPIFTQAAAKIAGPFRQFANTVISSFARPEVVKSIQAMANAFSKILTSLTPYVPTIMDSIAQAVAGIANTIAAHPKEFAMLINFFAQLLILTLRLIEGLTALGLFMIGTFANNLKSMSATFHTVIGVMGTAWSLFVIGIHAAWSAFINYFVLAGHQMEMDWNALCGNIHASWSNTVNFIHRIWSDFINFWVLTGHQLEAAWNRTCDVVHRAWSATVNALHIAWSNFINFFVSGGHQIEATWNSVCGAIHRAWSNTINALHVAWSGFVNFFVTAGHQIENAWNVVCGAISRAWNGVVNFIKNIWAGAQAFIQNTINTFYNAFHTAFGNILRAADWAFGWIPGIGPKLHAANAEFNGFRDQANAALGGIRDKTVQVNVVQNIQQKVNATAAAQGRFSPGSVAGRLAGGGPINFGTGPKADDVPIMASRGEFMHQAAAVDYYGLDFMESVNSMKLAAGGFIGGWRLPRSASLAYSFSGRPGAYSADATVTVGGSGTEYHAHFDGLTADAIESHVQTAFRAMSLLEGSFHRQGRRQ